MPASKCSKTAIDTTEGTYVKIKNKKKEDKVISSLN
jgi:hypothetical protein